MPGAPSQRRLIIGAAVGYGWASIAPFVLSLRASGYAGDVCLLVGKLSAGDQSHLSQNNICTIRASALSPRAHPRLLNVLFNRRFKKLYRTVPDWIDQLPIPKNAKLRLGFSYGTRLSHILCARFLHSFRLLRSPAAAQYDEIFLSDVRDVVFQADPFPYPINAPQCFALEDPSVTLGSEPHNRRWLGDIYGYGESNRLYNRPISCAGTTYGTRAGILEYLDAMTSSIIRTLHSVAGRPGYDQGLHNHLIATGQFPHARLVPNGEGPVLTIQEMDPARIQLHTDGVRDQAGRLIPVLHQYDRNQLLRDHFLRRFGS